MGIFKKVKKAFKKAVGKVHKLVIPKEVRSIAKKFRSAIGGLFAGPKIPDLPSSASAPTFAQAGGPASRSGVSQPNIGLSLISSGSASGLTKRAKTKKRSLIGGA